MHSLSDSPISKLSGGSTNEVLQSVIQGRKSWKTSRGSSEPVWPPQLEAALIEGLESYQPVDSRETRMLGRFPMRNRFISDHILRTTGKLRTPKQVGSRLQQLRDTCGGTRLLQLLSHSNYSESPEVTGTSTSQSSEGFLEQSRRDYNSGPSVFSNTPPTPPLSQAEYEFGFDDLAAFSATPPPRTSIFIDILPPNTSWSEPHIAERDFPVGAVGQWSREASPAASSSSSGSSSNESFRSSSQSRPLWAIDPTVAFIGRSTVSANSVFTVYANGLAVHTEITPLASLGPCPPEDAPEGMHNPTIYTAKLAPEFWRRICESNDPTCYTIIQDVYPENPNAYEPNTNVAMFSAHYEFRYTPVMPAFPLSTPMQQPSRVCSESPLITPTELYNDYFRDTSIVSFDDESFPNPPATTTTYYDSRVQCSPQKPDITPPAVLNRGQNGSLASNYSRSDYETLDGSISPSTSTFSHDSYYYTSIN